MSGRTRNQYNGHEVIYDIYEGETSMTEDAEKLIHEFVLDNIWKSINQTQEAINRIDEKANNMITVSGVLMTIIGSVLIGGFDDVNTLSTFFLLLILVPLVLCVGFSFKTIWLKDQEILGAEKAINFLHYTDYLQAIGDMSVSVCGWQNRLKKDIADKKSRNLLISMIFFLASLILIFLLAIIKIFLFLYS